MQTDDEDRLAEDIRRWLQQERIHNARQDRETILKFLWGCKNDAERAKLKMKNLYEMRRTTPELFQGRDPLLRNVEMLLRLGAFFPLPVKPALGHTLIMVKAAANDPGTIPMTDVFKVGIMSVDLLMELEKNLTRDGVAVIIDLRGVGLQHALQMTPRLIRKMVYLWQDCYPIRIQGIDFVNAPPGVDVVLNVFRRFLRENIKQRLRTHGSDLRSLHEVIEPRLLPGEYGGTLGPEGPIIEEWTRKVQTYRQWFLNDETLK